MDGLLECSLGAALIAAPEPLTDWGDGVLVLYRSKANRVPSDLGS